MTRLRGLALTAVGLLTVTGTLAIGPAPASAATNCGDHSASVPAWQVAQVSTKSTKNLYGRSVQVVSGFLNGQRYVYARMLKAPSETRQNIPYTGDSFFLMYGRDSGGGDIGGQGYCGTYVFTSPGKLNTAIYAAPYDNSVMFQACGGVKYPPPGGARSWCTPLWW